MRWKKTYTTLLIILALFIGAGAYVGLYILPYGIIVPLRIEPSENRERFPLGIHPDEMSLSYDSLEVVVADTMTIHGYVLHAQDSAKGAIIMLHGISSVKEALLGLGQWFTTQGWDAVPIDLRAHGDSEGTFNTYGFYEKQDVSLIIDSLHQERPDLIIGIYGNSLGGAIAYQALAADKRLSFGIIQSTFSHLPDIIQAYQRQLSFGLHFPNTTHNAIKKASQIANFPAFDIHPAFAATEVDQPMLIIHGLADENIDPSLGRENFDSLASQEKYWIPLPEANHYNVAEVGGQGLKDTIGWFLQRAKGL